jgi:hypothetical protein
MCTADGAAPSPLPAVMEENPLIRQHYARFLITQLFGAPALGGAAGLQLVVFLLLQDRQDEAEALLARWVFVCACDMVVCL